ncbi:MAG TPA: DUF3224 domain-containing protein [Streptosporangiaceae bacterium]|nr:DUF3224 domain-containing protein [Streptosporangiaceae bacterium]
MAARATGTFTVSSWDEDTYQELTDGGKLTRARVMFGLDGDLRGTSVVLTDAGRRAAARVS